MFETALSHTPIGHVVVVVFFLFFFVFFLFLFFFCFFFFFVFLLFFLTDHICFSYFFRGSHSDNFCHIIFYSDHWFLRRCLVLLISVHR